LAQAVYKYNYETYKVKSYNGSLPANIKTSINNLAPLKGSSYSDEAKVFDVTMQETVLTAIMNVKAPNTQTIIKNETQVVVERLQALQVLSNLSRFDEATGNPTKTSLKPLLPLDPRKYSNSQETFKMLTLLAQTDVTTYLKKLDTKVYIDQVKAAKKTFLNLFRDKIKPNLKELDRMGYIPSCDMTLLILRSRLLDLSKVTTYNEWIFTKLRNPTRFPIRDAFNEFHTTTIQTMLKDMIDLVDGYYAGFIVLAVFVFLFNIVVKTVYDIMNLNLKQNIVNCTLHNQCWADIIVGIGVLLQAISWGNEGSTTYENIHLRRCAIFFLHYSYYISTNCLLLHTFERVMVFRFPNVHAKIFTYPKSGLVIFVKWLLTIIPPVCHSAYVNIKAPAEYKPYMTTFFVLQLLTILLVWFFCAVVAWVAYQAKKMSFDIKSDIEIFFGHSVIMFVFYLPYIIVVSVHISGGALVPEHHLASLLVYLFTALIKPILTIALKDDYRNRFLCKLQPVDPAIQLFQN